MALKEEHGSMGYFESLGTPEGLRARIAKLEEELPAEYARSSDPEGLKRLYEGPSSELTHLRDWLAALEDPTGSKKARCFWCFRKKALSELGNRIGFLNCKKTNGLTGDNEDCA
jgi:hypothetical protein